MRASAYVALAGSAAIAAIALLSPADAEPPRGDRYELRQTEGGFLRLDRETGATKFCAPSADGYACLPADEATGENAKPDSAEIARLKERIASLEAQVKTLSSGLRSAPPLAKEPAPPESSRLRLPSDEEVDQLASFLERTFRRFKRFAAEIEKDGEPDAQRL